MAVVLRPQRTSSTTFIIYNVFLSFRRKDTRKNFTDHLHTALVNKGFRTFRDEEKIERGEHLKLELQKAIDGSKCSIVVFSKGYTSSGWCLDELVMILEQRRKRSRYLVLPVFYNMEPNEIRHFAKETQNTPWKEALFEVANLAGMVLQNEEDQHWRNWEVNDCQSCV